MNIEKLKKSGRIIFECVSGSHAYGLSVAESDTDIRGIYANPPSDYLGLNEPELQISDAKNDITYYSLKRVFELLQTANPNIIELLWMPEDCIRIQSPIMNRLIANRNIFISKKCYHTHIGYAIAQIERAKGKNKKVHNPQPIERPKKENFCYFVPNYKCADMIGINCFKKEALDSIKIAPCRPISIEHFNIDLLKYNCASLEHIADAYRLYYYGDSAKGVFRGNDMLVTESIPLNDEHEKFCGILIYKKAEYEQSVKNWNSYWDWRKNRNESRWVDQERGILDYDQKNLMHCLRLLLSGEHILLHGEPIVRFEGQLNDFLMDVRCGKYKYDELMTKIQSHMDDMKVLYDTSTIPHEVDQMAIDRLYRKMLPMKYRIIHYFLRKIKKV
ncbi:MAG: nucleotidyltransferase domain-containing protein [Methanomassiliicoccales archaeon]